MHQLKVAIAAALMMGPVMASAADASSSVEARLKALEERQNLLEQQLAERDARIRELESQTAKPTVTDGSAPIAVAPSLQSLRLQRRLPSCPRPPKRWWTTNPRRWSASQRQPAARRPKRTGAPTKAAGASCWRGRTMRRWISVSSRMSRYLNQLALEETYTDAFGRTKTLDLRNDVQLQKVMLYFKGWLMDPDFRYLFYAWTANTNMGQGAQVVVAGNLELPLQ